MQRYTRVPLGYLPTEKYFKEKETFIQTHTLYYQLF